MAPDLSQLAALYDRIKSSAWCLDIETVGIKGLITIVGLYRPCEGPVHCHQLIRGHNLTREALVSALSQCKGLITYNGTNWDIPKINAEFGYVIPEDFPHIDLSLFAKAYFGFRVNLKTIDNTFGIDPEGVRKKMRGYATRLWKQYVSSCFQNIHALNLLKQYNRDDTWRLYPIGEKLTGMFW